MKPGHGNWPGAIPSVHRWAYDYGKDGHEFIPQVVPNGAVDVKEKNIEEAH